MVLAALACGEPAVGEPSRRTGEVAFAVAAWLVTCVRTDPITFSIVRTAGESMAAADCSACWHTPTALTCAVLLICAGCVPTVPNSVDATNAMPSEVGNVLFQPVACRQEHDWDAVCVCVCVHGEGRGDSQRTTASTRPERRASTLS